MQYHLNLLFLTLFTFVSFIDINGQTISKEEWEILNKEIAAEKWAHAEKTCSNLLEKYKGQENFLDEAALVRYYYLQCVSAQLNQKQYSTRKSLTKVKMLKGNHIMSPVREFKEVGIYNYFSLNDDSTGFFSCLPDNAKKHIQLFELYFMADNSILGKTDSLEGKFIQLAGTIKDILAWGTDYKQFELIIENAYIYIPYGKENNNTPVLIK